MVDGMARLRTQQAAATGKAALLDYAVRHSPAVFYIADLKGQRPVRFISDNVEQMTGHPPADFLASAGFGRDRLHPEDRARYEATVQRLPDSGSARVEYRFRGADGQYLWVRDELRLLSDGEPGFVGCMLDITAEKSAEAQLRETSALVQTLMGHAMDGVIAIDLPGRVVEFNPAAERMFGWRREEALGRMLGDLIVPSGERRRVAAALAPMIAGGAQENGTRRLQIEAQRRDGTLFPVEITFARAQLEDRALVLAELRDISDRVAAQAERDRLHRLLQLAISSLPAGLCMTDDDERIVLCNEAFAEPFGRPAAEILGMTRSRSIELVLPFIASLDGQPVEPGAAARDRIVQRLREANLRPVELGMTDGRAMLVWSTRSPDGLVVSVRTDITPIKRAEAALAQSNAIIRQVLDACPVPVGMTRAEDSTVIYESRASQQLFGRPAGAVPARAVSSFVDPADRARYLTTLRREGAVEGFEVRMKRGDGSEFLAALSARLFAFQGEDVIVSSTFDLTARKESEAEQARQQEALHLSEKQAALGVLLAGVAHELNNPLSVVVGQALLLQESASDPATRLRAEKIGQAADRCARIVKAFLALARESPRRSAPVAPADIVAQALEVTGFLLRANDIAVRLRLPATLPAVLGDADQLVQVLANLMINAAQALQQRPAERRLTITARPGRRGTLRLKVKDNGPGVPAELQRRIFEPFFTTKAPGDGTGIGLALCHRVVAAHGGTLSLESRPGEGATFVITLPLATLPSDQAPPPLPLAQGRRQALVIDDEAEVAETLAQMLRSAGLTVTVALSGEVALGLLRRQDFDLILSDLRMPGLDGQQLHALLAAERPALLERLGFVTGDTMSEGARGFLAAAGRPALEKPVGRAELAGLLERLAAAPAG